MKRVAQNEFDQSTLEAMMERYRAELLRYQRATPPGKPTLEQNLKTASEKSLSVQQEQTANESEQDIWEQPAVLVNEIVEQRPENYDTAIETEEDLTERSVQPIEIEPVSPLPPIQPMETEPACSCHTEFEKCIAAYGSFIPYQPLGDFCRASFLRSASDPTPVVARFAADIPQGDAESRRCRRSFSVRFFCNEGFYDMLGSFLPVAIADSPQLLERFSSSMRTDPVTGLRGCDRFWKAAVDAPSSLPAILRLYTDLGTIGSYRMADGFSLAAVWTGDSGKKRLVRTRWLSRRRPTTLSRFEAEELAGSDPDALSRDLVQAIQSGEKVQYELAAQFMNYPPDECGFDPLDPTRDWPEHRFPLQKLGMMTLDRLPENFSSEIMPLSLSGENLVDGIEPAPLKAADGLSAAADYLTSLGELSRKTLVSNLADELGSLEADLLEAVLILMTRTELQFGRALTSALGGS